jgi:Phosphodiester glycosidase
VFFGIGATVLALLVVFLALQVAIVLSPAFGGWGAETMRAVLGDQVTAAVEGFSLTVQDVIHRATYALGLGHEKDVLTAEDSTTTTRSTAPPTTTPTTPETSPGGEPAVTSSSTTTTTEAPWQPAAVQAMGTLDNEGRWSPYLFDTSGRAFGYRTALQPDPGRGFAVAAVVAMDLKNARLHFILGSDEPKARTPIARDGKIPQIDLQPGRLLGAFNGGFQAEHGAFGAMANGVEALPARDGFSTLVIYKDGRVDVGAWGKDFVASADMESWRQNGPLVISGGQITDKVGNSDPHIWGFVFGGGVAAWRSAVGISQDRRTLYFVVGPSLTIESLAAAMRRAGVWAGFELDINHLWTRFDKVTVKDGKLVAQTVIGGIPSDNRLIRGYRRDFFYLTGS